MRQKSLCLIFALLSQLASAGSLLATGPYVGLLTGYGSTTWQELVGTDTASWASTPNSAKEGGLLWGLVLGYDFNPHIGIELAYLHLPQAAITFDPNSASHYVWDDNVTAMNTQTEAVALSTQIYAPLSKRWRIFAKIGVEATHRHDHVTAMRDPTQPAATSLARFSWRIGAVFGGGLRYTMSRRWSTQVGFDYLTGYAESNTNPVYTYDPFIYAGYINFSYVLT